MPFNQIAPELTIADVVIAGPDDQLPPEYAPYHTLRDHESALRHLQNTSHSVTKLVYLAASYTDAEKAAISQAIAAHCAHTLVEISLEEAGPHLLVADDETVFSEVSGVRLTYEALPDELALDRIYPALEELSITALHKSGEHLAENSAKIMEILPWITKLQALSIVGPANSILPTIQADLGYLEALAIGFDMLEPETDEKFHFSDVVLFKLTLYPQTVGNYERVDIPITFDQLEELQLDAEHIVPAVRNWIEMYEELRSFASVGLVRSAEEMAALLGTIAKLPQLEEVTLNISESPNVGEKLRQLSNSVKTATFIHNYSHTSGLDEELKDIPVEWHSASGWQDTGRLHSIMFERKSSVSE